MPENLSALSGRQGLDNNLFEKLVEGAKESGTPNPELLRELAEEFLMGKAITYGIFAAVVMVDDGNDDSLFTQRSFG